MGMIFAPHKKAGELSKALLNVKDILLVGFFLNIGFDTITLDALLIALLLIVVLPLKVSLYYAFTNMFKLRARTLLSAFTSQQLQRVRLIVCAVASASGLIAADWLAVVAIAVSITFVIPSQLTSAPMKFVKLEPWLLKFESNDRLEEKCPLT